MASRLSSVKETIDRALHDDKQPWTKYFALAEQRTGVNRSQLFIGLVGFIAFYLVFGFWSQLLCNLIGFVYPAYCSMKAIETRQKEDDTKWLTYWVVFATASVVEFFSDFIVRWVPLYWLLKCVFLVWCFLPFSSNGSSFIYYRFIRPYFLRHQGDVDGLLNEVGDKVLKAAANIKSD